MTFREVALRFNAERGAVRGRGRSLNLREINFTGSLRWRDMDGRHVCSVPLGANRRSDLLGTLPVMIRAHSIASGNSTKCRWKCRWKCRLNVSFEISLEWRSTGCCTQILLRFLPSMSS